jgi:hypothetical protein
VALGSIFDEARWIGRWKRRKLVKRRKRASRAGETQIDALEEVLKQVRPLSPEGAALLLVWVGLAPERASSVGLGVGPIQARD